MRRLLSAPLRPSQPTFSRVNPFACRQIVIDELKLTAAFVERLFLLLAPFLFQSLLSACPFVIRLPTRKLNAERDRLTLMSSLDKKSTGRHTLLLSLAGCLLSSPMRVYRSDLTADGSSP